MSEYVLNKANESTAAFMTDKAAFADRQQFVKNLGWLLSQTREGVLSCDLVNPSEYEEYVLVTYIGGEQKKINVFMNGYAEIMIDVTARLHWED